MWELPLRVELKPQPPLKNPIPQCLKSSFHTREFVVVSQCSFVSTTVKCAREKKKVEKQTCYSRKIRKNCEKNFFHIRFMIRCREEK